jgi:hypothetical protein
VSPVTPTAWNIPITTNLYWNSSKNTDNKKQKQKTNAIQSSDSVARNLHNRLAASIPWWTERWLVFSHRQSVRPACRKQTLANVRTRRHTHAQTVTAAHIQHATHNPNLNWTQQTSFCPAPSRFSPRLTEPEWIIVKMLSNAKSLQESGITRPVYVIVSELVLLRN